MVTIDRPPQILVVLDNRQGLILNAAGKNHQATFTRKNID